MAALWRWSVTTSRAALEIPDAPNCSGSRSTMSAAWTAPAQSASGSFDLTFTVNTDKYPAEHAGKGGRCGHYRHAQPDRRQRGRRQLADDSCRGSRPLPQAVTRRMTVFTSTAAMVLPHGRCITRCPRPAPVRSAGRKDRSPAKQKQTPQQKPPRMRPSGSCRTKRRAWWMPLLPSARAQLANIYIQLR